MKDRHLSLLVLYEQFVNKQTKKKPDQGGDHHDNHQHHDQGDVDHDSCICRPAGFLSAT